MAAIGFFDSGAGGISVLKRVRQILPKEELILFGDSKNAPYGTKTKDELIALSKIALDKLLKFDIKALVIACNTLTSLILDDIKAMVKIPVVGIMPPIEKAAELAGKKTALILATKNTLSSQSVKSLIEKNKALALCGGGLMKFVERGEISGDRLSAYIDGLLSQVNTDDIGALALGCTHYPFIKRALEQKFSQGTPFIDGGEQTAKELYDILLKNNLLDKNGNGATSLYSSADNTDIMQKLLNMDI